MMPGRTLVLLRHARAEAGGYKGDYTRPLTARGRRQAEALGPRLAEVAGPFDIAMVSSAMRTQETYRLLAGRAPEYPRPRVVDELYEIGSRRLLETLRALPETARKVIVVGHEPTMSSLAALLHDATDDYGAQLSFGIPSATACILDIAREWEHLDGKAGRLRGILRPKE